MKMEQQYWAVGKGWKWESEATLNGKASLVLVFGSSQLIGDAAKMDEVRKRYPGAQFAGCSTSGEI